MNNRLDDTLNNQNNDQNNDQILRTGQAPPFERSILARFIHFTRANLSFFVLIAILLVVRGAIANQYLVPSGSMEPSIAIGDRVFVNRVAYDLKVPLTQIAIARLGEPKRGDVVVFDSPEDGKVLIKRLIALPGDDVKIIDGCVWINGQALSQSYGSLAVRDEMSPAKVYSENLNNKTYNVQRLPSRILRGEFEFDVPSESYFMMGDNRDNSHDSRAWGFAPRSALIGRASRVIFSLNFARPFGEMLDWRRTGVYL